MAKSKRFLSGFLAAAFMAVAVPSADVSAQTAAVQQPPAVAAQAPDLVKKNVDVREETSHAGKPRNGLRQRRAVSDKWVRARQSSPTRDARICQPSARERGTCRELDRVCNPNYRHEPRFELRCSPAA